MKPISPFGLPLGISFTVWTIAGILRYLSERISGSKKQIQKPGFSPSDIAAVIPAHNEELIIRRCIQALRKVLNKNQIYVVSDGSTDKTYRRARLEKCHVSNLLPGRGKAKGLKYLFTRYKLFERYKFIFIVDADTNMDPTCLIHALPLFNDKNVGVVFASSQIKWKQHIIPKLSYYFISYRDRLNRLLQYCFVYGQTWKYTNVIYVIPGFATIYRSEILEKLEIDTPGLLIEDFNLAFQFHKKKLGKIGYNPAMIGWDQYPTNLSDYWKQVRRWNIGFFQTVKKNGLWLSFFWLTLGVFSIEIVLNSIFLIFLPLYFLSLFSSVLSFPPITMLSYAFSSFSIYKNVTPTDILIGIFLIDYTITVVIGLVNKKPQFIFYGLFFFFMHYITSLILISSLIPGFFGKSRGLWTSPKRSSSV
ncbi:MAG: glycosyltransferase [Candidatus Levybacteria bacterium]|nr:glycosyltransferase [Candidatus Levybacteria bacterium]